MRKNLSPRAKRRTFVALLCLAPLLLFAIVREKYSWLPRPLPLSPQLGVMDIEWMADSKTLVVTGYEENEKESVRELQFWDVNTRSRIAKPQFQKGKYDQFFQGRDLIVLLDVTESNRTRWTVINAKSEKQIGSFYVKDSEQAFLAPDGQKFCTMELKTDGAYLSRTYQTKPLRLLRETTIKPPKQVRFTKTITLSPDLTVGAAGYDRFIGALLFDVRTGKHLKQFSDPSMGYSDDSQTVFSGNTGAVQLTDAHSGQSKGILRVPLALHIKPTQLLTGDKRWLVGSNGQSVFAWDVATNKLLREIKTKSAPIGFALSPDQNTLAVFTDTGQVLLYRMR